MEALKVRVKGLPGLTGRKLQVPGDISSAAFFLVAAAIVPAGKLTISGVGINPTRTGIIDVLREMGANIWLDNLTEDNAEPIGDISIEASSLKGIKLGGEIIPRLVDEIPVIAVAAACAEGVTEIRDAAELKVKESNRISAICQGLVKMGARVEELPDGLRIYGGKKLKGGCSVESYNDHRIAMALAVGGLVAEKETIITDSDAINVSFPGFKTLLDSL